ncbi:MAG: hypothetical protein KF749_01345 [Bacteroidetes bacterium]|nr:hypothetical protein [Bacteroidota bacterium]MCW5896158.1 hypothetical protein [Bacteroidota bacterium]
MTLTVLASVFLLLILVVAFVGFKAVIRQGKPPEELNMERCSICREKYNTSMLIERQIGDYKLLYFCPSCIHRLHNQLLSKN